MIELAFILYGLVWCLAMVFVVYRFAKVALSSVYCGECGRYAEHLNPDTDNCFPCDAKIHARHRRQDNDRD